MLIAYSNFGNPTENTFDNGVKHFLSVIICSWSVNGLDMAAKSSRTNAARTLSPLEQDICRILARHGTKNRADILQVLVRGRNGTVDSAAVNDALSDLERSGYVEGHIDAQDIAEWYRLTEPARRELQIEWSWEGRDIRGGARDAY